MAACDTLGTASLNVTPREEAAALFAQTTARWTRGWNLVACFRRVGKIGLAQGPDLLLKEHADLFDKLQNDPGYEGILKDPSAISKTDVDMFAHTMVNHTVQSASAVIDAATVVFAHAVIDDAALDCCRITTLVAPDAWAERLKDRRIRLAEQRGSNADDVLRRLMDAELKQLSHESLMTKFALVFAICRPPSGWTAFTDGTVYDPDRLRRFDRFRHDLVHGSALQVPLIASIELELWYVFRMPLALLVLLAETFGLGATADDLMKAMRAVSANDVSPRAQEPR